MKNFNSPHRTLSLFFAFLVLATSSIAAPISVLVFTRTEGFSHSSISDGVDMLNEIAATEGYTITETDQTDLFTTEGLDDFDVVVWLSTTGDVLDNDEQDAFEAFIQGGGGYVGIHAAADCEYGWPWYGDLLGGGAWFNSHPSIQEARLVLEDATHPITGTWEAETIFEDEWYNFQNNPRDFVDVIQTLDESSYDPGSGAMGDDHPIAWSHLFDGGRVFYTALGHRSETYEDSRFRDQIRDAIEWTGFSSRISWKVMKAPSKGSQR